SADGSLDIAVTNTGSNTVSILFNIANSGQFTAPVNVTVGNGPRGLAAVDLDADGDIDLVVANRLDSNIQILTNNGTGTFTPGATFASFGAATNWDVCATGPNGPISCSETTLAAGGTLTLVYTLNIDAGDANGSILSNTATVSATTFDADSSNNSTTFNSTVSSNVTVTGTGNDDTLVLNAPSANSRTYQT